jgi:hypothetical protein
MVGMASDHPAAKYHSGTVVLVEFGSPVSCGIGAAGKICKYIASTHMGKICNSPLLGYHQMDFCFSFSSLC